jgi:PKD repeat protein
VAGVPPVVTLSATPSEGPSPLATTLTWSVTNNPTLCVGSGGQGSWVGSKTQLVSGSETISGITTPAVFTLTCSNSAGSGSASVSTTIMPPTNGTLVVQKTQGGTVTSNPPHNGHIICGKNGNACSRVYTGGTTVTLTAIPESTLWQFVGWQGSCRGSGPCQVYIRGNDITETVKPFFMLRPVKTEEF